MRPFALSRQASDCGTRMTFGVGDEAACVVGRGVAVYTRGGKRIIGTGVIGWA